MRALSITRHDLREAAIGGGLLICALAMVLRGVEPAAAQGGSAERPNIVLITTDDQPAHTVTPELMPRLHQSIVNRGTSFTDYIVVTPLCCPSRATTITGQYGHNHGVLRNEYGDLRQKRNVLPVWLRRAGYLTAHVGKWMNGYETAVPDRREVAPGWHRWFTQLAPRRYYRWRASKNGRLEFFGRRGRHHATRVTNQVAARWTRRMARHRRPFFLYLNYLAPHSGARRDDASCRGAPVPVPIDKGKFADAPLPRPPSFNPIDVSDKPGFVRRRPPMDAEAIDRATNRYRCSLESMLSVDRGIRRLEWILRRERQRRQTILIFTSDNGYFYGEHRISRGKLHPYEENIRMPLTIVAPRAYRDGARRVAESDAPVANIDLAPTILDLAGAAPCRDRDRTECRILDGRSLMPVLQRGRFPSLRAFAIEQRTCAYRGIRLDRHVYFEHGEALLPFDGRCDPSEFEHYDLDADPYQTNNLYPASPSSATTRRQAELRRRLREVVGCQGIEGRDPPPPGGWCG